MTLLEEFARSQAGDGAVDTVATRLGEVQAFLDWLQAQGQPVTVSRTALVKYKDYLATVEGLDRDSLRERLAGVKRFVTWYERTYPASTLVAPSFSSDGDRTLAELQALKNIAETLNQSVEVQEAVDAALAEVTAMLGLSTGWVFLLDEADNFIPIDAIGLPPALADEDWRELRRGPDCECQWQLRTGQLKRAVNVVQCSRLEEAPGDTGGLSYHASVPIRARKRTLGVLNVTGPSREVFSSADLQVLGAIGDQLGMAIERARLLDTARMRRLREQDVLLRLAHGLLSSLDLGEMTQLVVSEATSILGADAGSFILLGEGDQVTLRATVGWSEEWLARSDLRLMPGGLTARSLETRRPIIETDLLATPAAQSPVIQSHGWRSGLAVPVELDEQAIGVLSLQSRAPDHFNDDDSRLLGLMATQVAMAVRNAREYEEKAQEAWHRNALLQVAENIRDLTRVEDVLETVGRLAPMFLGASLCGFCMYSPSVRTFVPRLLTGADNPAPDTLTRFFSLSTTSSRPPFDRLLTEWAPFILERRELAEADTELFSLFGVERLLLVPLRARGGLVGAMVLDIEGDQARYTARLLEIAAGIGNQTAIAIERESLRLVEREAERLNQELTLARHIQRSFLPDQAPAIRGWDICPHWEPARTVTGDFYDFVSQSDGRMGIVIADVSDKGAPAAIFMAVSRSLLRASIMANAYPTSSIAHANRLIAADAESSMFVTAFHLALASDSGAIAYVNAGHNPPLLLRADGRVEWLGQAVHGPVLGVLPEVDWTEETAHLEPGDSLILYTDGITEAINPLSEAFGEERLVETVRQVGAGLAQEIAQRIVQAVTDFAAGQPQYDDMTLVVLKRVRE